MEVRFFDDPAAFLETAGGVLAEQPVLSTVIAGIAERIRAQRAAGLPWPDGVPCWFAAVVEDGQVVGTAMRTAPFGDYPAYVMPMSEEAVHEVSRSLLDRGEPVLAANGALPAVRTFCEDMATATGKRARVAQHTRLFELGGLVEPGRVPGGLRRARGDELGLVASWYAAFMADADEQAGREPGASAHETPGEDELARRIEGGRVFVWADERDRPVNLTAATAPAYGVARVGPVYTPKEQRGHGYASAAVHAVSAWLRGRGERPCLFTDQANPTSNKIYEAIGYRPLVDMANLLVE
ncbi:MAG TPA: GNAT family N-acetyltransferase [Nocardioides sp.]|jgi:GNAT superfamily N-acetyltransferase|uniref:GNAT family N-acetyltransferase n=1 Tax=Nocardioides sp. TaxID=35761 RepID=UPI002E3362B2|nr:GNAT family N-acetyltransferase [Nocardioides sp.]HEX3931879.1 GNAT family N-acetyltransferase [Nocardioides sp.]